MTYLPPELGVGGLPPELGVGGKVRRSCTSLIYPLTSEAIQPPNPPILGDFRQPLKPPELGVGGKSVSPI